MAEDRPMPTNPIPEGYGSPIPYLIVNDGASALAFYAKAFDAVESVRLVDPTGKVMHAEIRIGGFPLMLADEFPEMGYRSPASVGGSSTSILLYVQDVDAQFKKAIAFGATERMAVQDQFDGDRRGTLEDPFGDIWLLASRRETVSFEELKNRFEAMIGQGHS